MTLCILGAGAFGSAIAITLAKNSSAIILWSRSQKFAEELQKSRENKRYLIESHFPKNVQITNDIHLVMKKASTIIICIPTQKINSFLSKYHLITPNIPIILCSKGIDENTSLLVSQLIKKWLPKNQIACLTGPSFANEIARGLPTALTLACENSKIRLYLQETLSNQNLRLYSSADIIGAQIGGALKNVIAIGCGMIKGIELGESARIAFMTRGLSEIIDIGTAMGAEMNTFYGLSGLGDLALTCNSVQSRNFSLGLNFSKNLNTEFEGTIEGVKTASAAKKLAKRVNVQVPIISSVDLILKQKLSVKASIKDLLRRPLKKEVS